jgi:hypothetical protein
VALKYPEVSPDSGEAVRVPASLPTLTLLKASVTPAIFLTEIPERFGLLLFIRGVVVLVKVPVVAQHNRVAWLAGTVSFSNLVVVVSELVCYVVGPLELAKGKGGRHEQV